jgi:CDP-diacylglycerol--serine O-phosphatidyltransferase
MFIGFYGASVALTYLGLAFGVVGMSLAFNGNIPEAVMCLILAGVCDMFDGTVARACKRTEQERKFGIQIDSLADTVSFGVFPIILGICMGFTNKLHIVIYVLYALAAVIRLGYFNVMAEEKTISRKKDKVSYYIGLPVTSIAIILPFTYNLNIFKPEIFSKAYPLVMFMVALLFVLNFKLKKPAGLWLVICSILAVIEIAVISAIIL